jgi:uncharacterized BrkB/YihY/UPF0761 family membrane protein
LAVPTNVVCGFLLPLAYVGFIVLQRNREYLGADRPEGAKGRAWLLGMIVSTLTLVGFLLWFAATNLPSWFEQISQGA